ncbi:MAG: flagellar protein FlaG [Lachnospiraceae bacterium]|nr:flagellar protein FlaG [Lachnospiraceae bacterium]
MEIESINGLSRSDTNYSSSRKTVSPVESTETKQQDITIEEKKVRTEKEQSDKKDNSRGEGEAGEKQIKEAVAQTNHKIKKQPQTTCEFSYHEETGRISITVRDKESQKVIREIPPEKSLDMLQKMWELAGILVDEKR